MYICTKTQLFTFKAEVLVMAHSHCTGPGTGTAQGVGPGTGWTVHTAVQGMVHGI